MNKNISPKMDIKMVRTVQKMRAKGLGYLKISKILTKKHKKSYSSKKCVSMGTLHHRLTLLSNILSFPQLAIDDIGS
jgi:hypothetical protein